MKNQDANGRGRSLFDRSPVDRRTFLGLIAATGTALTLPGNSTASGGVRDPRVSDVCEFVINNTPDGYETATLVEFEDEDTANWFDSQFEYEDRRQEDPVKTVIRTEPEPAGHGLLTSAEISTLLDEGGVDSVEFSPGANPFWQLNGYDDGVFPDPIDSRDYLSYGEVIAGVSHLEATHPDRVNTQTIGKSPGWYDQVSEKDTQWDVHVTEVTNDINSTSFAEKEKVAYSLCIHGDERAGAEAGYRLIEDILSGDAPEIEQLLDDIVLVFLLTNPDGWVSREPWTEVWTQGHDRNFQRGNSGFWEGQIDTNRQYPTVGWTDASFLPAEPDDSPAFFEDEVPDALAIVEHFREYDNVSLFCDYHGMYTADHMMYYLESNASLDHTQTHALDEVSRRTGRALLRHWGGVEEIEDDITDAIEAEYGWGSPPDGDQFGGLFDWGTTYDTIDYQVTGGIIGWAGADEEFGGLGAVAVSPEMVVSNNFGSAIKEWKTWWARHYTAAYDRSLREWAKLAAVETDATVATGTRDTAYVTTEELTRSSADLPFTGETTDTDGSTTVRSDRTVLSSEQSMTVQTESDAHSLTVRFGNTSRGGTAQLVAPDGTVRRTTQLGPEYWADATPALFVLSPETGDWTVEVDGTTDVSVRTSVLASNSSYPNPTEAWDGEGFEQRSYEVNPMGFFDDLSDSLVDGSLDGIDTADVSDGDVTEYDQLVISHDVGLDDADYIDAVDSFVDAGGDLVLTDRGIHILAELDTVEEIAQPDIEDTTLEFATLSNTDQEHPLLDGVRDRQQELYKGSEVGYTTGVDQPATVIALSAFNDADGDVVGWMDGWNVGLGRLTVDESTIDCIGSILPPAQQEDILHPFGLSDHAVSVMGHTVLCNALKFEQRRFVAGELTRTIGPDWRGVEHTIGDVDRDGDIDIVDAVRIQQQLVELDPAPFDPELADITRDGDISVADSIALKRLLAGLDEPGELELHGSSASVEHDTLSIHATVENTGDLGAIRETEFRLAQSTDQLDDHAVVALKRADPPGNSEQTVVASLETTALSPGTTYQYSVRCAGQETVGEVKIPE